MFLMRFTVVMGLIWSLAPLVGAQTASDCPQEIIDALELQFPGEGRGAGPLECQDWKHGLGDGKPGSIFTRQRPGGPPPCGAANVINFGKGQIVFTEPIDSVCDPAVDVSCPIVTKAGATAAERSIAGVAARNDLGSFALNPGVIVSFEGARGFREDCGTSPNAVADCGPGQTQLRWDDTAIGQAFNFNTNGDAVTTGDTFCCDSIDDLFCENVLGFDEYPNLTIPFVNNIPFRKGTPSLVFDGGRGTGFMSSQTTVTPGQLYGNCTINEAVPCDLVGNDPCPSLGDTCNLAERGFRLNEVDLLPSGFPNASRCGHGYATVVGRPVDPGTGRSINCGLVTWYSVDNTGDPGPSCLVKNFGSYTDPDLDCDGIADDTDGDGQPGPDLCPSFSEVDHFLDANTDGIGDECQCGDVNVDGAITGLDIGGTALCANGALGCDSSLADADGDFSTTALDIAGVVAVVNGDAQTSALSCRRNP